MTKHMLNTEHCLHWACGTGLLPRATGKQSISSQWDSGTVVCWYDRTKNL